MNLMVTRIQWFISMLYISITDYVRLIRNDTTIGRIELSGSKNMLSLILKVLTAQLLGILLIVFLTSANKDNAEMIVYDKSQNGQSTEGSPKEQQETQVQLNTSFINYARSRYGFVCGGKIETRRRSYIHSTGPTETNVSNNY
ncbi:hypothetical protein ACOME3_001492 [Neoechinorhynchus agilis]